MKAAGNMCLARAAFKQQQMPQLANAKHELFAHGLASGKSQEHAYKLAGFTGHRSSASRLATNASVCERVQELLQTRRVLLSRNDILSMLLEDRCDARNAKQYAVAVKCDQLLGQELHGMFVERKEMLVGFAEVDSIRDLVEKAHRELGQKAAALLLEYHKEHSEPGTEAPSSIMELMRRPSAQAEDEIQGMRQDAAADEDSGQTEDIG